MAEETARVTRRLRLTVAAGPVTTRGFSTSIGATGLSLDARVVFDPGTKVTGTIGLPSGEEIPLAATVTGCRRPVGLIAGAVAGSMDLAFDGAMPDVYRALLTARASEAPRANTQPSHPVPAPLVKPAAAASPAALPAPSSPPLGANVATTPPARPYRRFDLRLPALCQTLAGGAPQRAETRQLAEGGCTLVVMRLETPTTRLFVHLTLPSGERVKLLGTIAWSRQGLPATMGVRFEPGQRLPDELRALLDETEADARVNETSEIEVIRSSPEHDSGRHVI